MSTLVIETLRTSLEQVIECKTESRVHIAAIIPYLYFHNLTSGEFKFELSTTERVIYQHDFSWIDIKGDSQGEYIRVFHPIVPTDPIQLESGVYTFKISAISGYEAQSDSFLGWVKQHEDIQLPMAYVPGSDIKNTFTLRFKEYKEGQYV
jgi:hypothetical protein